MRNSHVLCRVCVLCACVRVCQQVLDSQLKMFNDFYSMLSSEVHVKKSTRLEWAIIFLISIEVVFGVADHSDWLASFIP